MMLTLGEAIFIYIIGIFIFGKFFHYKYKKDLCRYRGPRKLKSDTIITAIYWPMALPLALIDEGSKLFKTYIKGPY